MKGAASLRHRVDFLSAHREPDGSGGTIRTWVDEFTARAAFKHLHGSESVLAGRLTGTHAQIIRVRASSETRRIDSSWIAKDENGVTYNIRDVTETEDRAFIDILAESGVAI